MKFTNQSEECSLLDVVMKNVGYSSATKARKIIKSGRVKVGGKLNRIPSAIVSTNQEVELLDKPQVDVRVKATPSAPYPVVFENDKILAYIKPPGIVTAHQSAKIKSSYSYMKRFMESQNPDNTDLNFVNKIDKEATGIAIIAKSLKWRKVLQNNWENFTRRYYILVEGEAHDKGVFDLTTKEERNTYDVRFRLMRTNGLYSLLRIDIEPGMPDHFEGDLEAIGVKMLGHGRMKKSDLGYKAKHLFAVNLVDSDGNKIADLKTPVPKAFLKLVK